MIANFTKMKLKKFFGSILLAVAAGVIAVFIYTTFDQKEQTIVVQERPSMQYVNLPGAATAAPTDFIVAAETAVNAVVHVKTQSMRESRGNSIYEFFYGYRDTEPSPVTGYGSGVILSSDGYIATNNHVIEGSEDLEVILNDRRSFEAEIIGTDPNTDIAVIKISEKDLPFLKFGDSDQLRLGEWVLAVGNPYNLTSTVTAGIVSAKARNINILNRRLSIESFIQTDAAVNPGNSGGALVNTRGELVGINSAIASRTGAYTGYSFAIPASIVNKVTKDLIEFGAVQRALLGVNIVDVTADNAGENNIDLIEGVLITALVPDGAALSAGIEKNDVVIAINGIKVNTTSELMEQVSLYRPNDKISVTLRRKNKTLQKNVILRNPDGGTGIVERATVISTLGASFEKISNQEKRDLGIKNGLKVSELRSGKFRSEGIREGFIITEIDTQAINNTDDITRIIENDSDGGIYIKGIYPDGKIAYYAIPL
jgi:serine protease Do